MSLLLKWIIRCGSSLYRYLCCLDLKRLLRLRGSYQCSLDNDGRSNIQLGNLCEILHVIVIYDLKSFKKASIMKYDESKRLGITNTSYPSTYSDLFVKILFTVSVNLFHCCQFHNLYLIPHIQDHTSLRTSKRPYRIKYRLFSWFVQGVIALSDRKIAGRRTEKSRLAECLRQTGFFCQLYH